MKPNRNREEKNIKMVSHLQRLASIFDKLVTIIIAALVSGIAFPKWFASLGAIDWGVESILAITAILLYYVSILIQNGMEK